MGTVEIDPSNAKRLLSPRPIVLVTSVAEGKSPNIIPLGWSMPTSFTPPLVAISVATRRFSHGLIEESGEFVVNLPSRELLREIQFCGSCSGRSVDKFKETGLTPIPSERVKPPRIKGCVAHLECKLAGKFRTGDHTIFVGEVVASSADDKIFDEESGALDLDRAQPIFHMGGKYFATPGERFKSE
jgi:flavin reductase (DIM6/NTAB) family NADH-FMN oxidoreductase RutF